MILEVLVSVMILCADQVIVVPWIMSDPWIE